MRSKLFVPGSRPELFSKALNSEADAISIDLEDAVVEDRKAQARTQVGDWLQNPQRPTTHQLIIVRVNAMDTPHFAQDVAAVVRPGLDILNLPKPDSADAVREAAQAIARAEKANGVTQPVRILLNIESPKALREAAALAQADARVMGLQVGLGDLFEPLGIDRREVAAVQQVLLAVRMAAGEAGIEAWDGAFANVRDTEGYLAEAHLARRLGLSGKTCIHPSQIALANEVMSPSEAEVTRAQRILAAMEQAAAEGKGAVSLDGRLIDYASIRQAEVLAANIDGFAVYPPNDGTPELLSAITGWIKRRYGATLGDDQVMVLNGTREGLYNALIATCPETKNGAQPIVLTGLAAMAGARVEPLVTPPPSTMRAGSMTVWKVASARPMYHAMMRLPGCPAGSSESDLPQRAMTAAGVKVEEPSELAADGGAVGVEDVLVEETIIEVVAEADASDLADIFGATPGNVVSRLLEDGKIEAVCGVSLPMLLRVLRAWHGQVLQRVAAEDEVVALGEGHVAGVQALEAPVEHVEADEPSPNPSLEADKLKEYLERMDPQDFGKFNP